MVEGGLGRRIYRTKIRIMYRSNQQVLMFYLCLPRMEVFSLSNTAEKWLG